MDRMKDSTAFSYWKLSVLISIFITATSLLSVKSHECAKLPRKHVLKYMDLLREAARSSVSASQSCHPVQAFIDSSRAVSAIKVVDEFLTQDQVKSMMSIDLMEMKAYIEKQHDSSLRALLEAYSDEPSNDRFTPVAQIPSAIFNSR